MDSRQKEKTGHRLISVIIPVYNVERYLDRCISSVTGQSYRNLEIILLDDGSTDSSGKICDAYASKDGRIRALHHENQGLAGARNTGLDLVTGDLVFFLDSDDWIEPDCLEALTTAMEQTGVDLAVGGSRGRKEKEDHRGEPIFNLRSKDTRLKEKMNKKSVKSAIILLRNELERRLLYQQGISTSAWGKLYRRELFDGIRFEEGRLFEDVVPIFQICSRAERAVWVQEPLYVYTKRQGSITKSRFSLRQLDYVDNCAKLLHCVREHCPELEAGAVNRLVWAEYYVIAHSQKGDLSAYTERELWEHIRECRGVVLKDKNSVAKVRAAMLLSLFGKEAVRFVYRTFLG